MNKNVINFCYLFQMIESLKTYVTEPETCQLIESVRKAFTPVVNTQHILLQDEVDSSPINTENINCSTNK